MVSIEDAAKQITELVTYPLAARIACRLHLSGWTEATFHDALQTARFRTIPDPAKLAVQNALRDIEWAGGPNKRLVALSLS